MSEIKIRALDYTGTVNEDVGLPMFTRYYRVIGMYDGNDPKIGDVNGWIEKKQAEAAEEIIAKRIAALGIKVIHNPGVDLEGGWFPVFDVVATRNQIMKLTNNWIERGQAPKMSTGRRIKSVFFGTRGRTLTTGAAVLLAVGGAYAIMKGRRMRRGLGEIDEGRPPILPHEPDPWDIDPLLTSPGLRRAAARKERAEQRAAEKKQTLFRRAERRPILPKAPEELSALEYTCKERCGDLMGDRKAYRACLDSCVEGGGWKKPKGEMYGAFSSMFGDAIDDRIETAPIAELQAIRKDLNAAIKGGQYQTEIGGQRVLIPVVLGKVNARLKSLNAFAGDSGLTCTCRGKTVVKPIQLRFLSCESFCKGK